MRSTLTVDIAVAVTLAVLAVIVSPGLAVAGMLALAVLVLCGLTVLLDHSRARRGPVGRARRAPARGPARRL